MAIGAHVATIIRSPNSVGPNTSTVADDVAVPNTSGSPTVNVYIALEAADNYLVSLITDSIIVTYSVTDMNAA